MNLKILFIYHYTILPVLFFSFIFMFLFQILFIHLLNKKFGENWKKKNENLKKKY